MSYPKIDGSSIWAVLEFVEQAKASPEILNDKELPYPTEFINLVKSIAIKVQAKKAVASTIEELEQQVTDIYDELDDFKAAINMDENGQVFVSYMRLRGQLLAKLVEIKERIFNVKKMKEFQDQVLKALDMICTAEQKTKLIDILEGRTV